ncbi:MAG TPA: hypothetical protein VNQ56_00780 [Pseudolabrys sp.]|nr:hypothetical protein [Pseudolabrys sp.]
MTRIKKSTRWNYVDTRAWIRLDSADLIPCMLTEVSETTARLVTDASIPAATKFELYLTLNGVVKRRCSSVDQDAKGISIKFDDVGPNPDSPDFPTSAESTSGHCRYRHPIKHKLGVRLSKRNYMHYNR